MNQFISAGGTSPILAPATTTAVPERIRAAVRAGHSLQIRLLKIDTGVTFALSAVALSRDARQLVRRALHRIVPRRRRLPRFFPAEGFLPSISALARPGQNFAAGG